MNRIKKIIHFILLINTSIFFSSTMASPINLSKSNFANLPGWNADEQHQALIAFKQSCTEITQRYEHAPFNHMRQTGQVNEWQQICKAAAHVATTDRKAAKQFFEYWFEPYYVKDTANHEGLFTGYYLPLIQASLTKTNRYHIPIYALPTDLVKLPSDASRKPNVRQRKNGQLYPYPDRAAINHGAIANSADVIAWTDNLVDLFFAQVQGSAIVQLPNKQKFLIGYAGGNGRAYTSIGKMLVGNGAITKEAISMRTIKQWLTQHPKQMSTILNSNASYVFFRKLSEQAPFGTERVGLTPERSLAVDTHFIPLGAPIWLDTVIPKYKHQDKLISYQHLLIAQDTGGAINGVVRGDIYWGHGDKAAFFAGEMKSPGQYWILLPRKIF